ncbi:Dihydropyrimidine dehydrogenase [NADP(+)] [Glycine max]|nr:Dihydropyrimidine dehydrogenase [NADP(+)] [Glycine max]
MDPKRSIEDQFSKLHPSMPVNTRIGIVGAGSSGLSIAYALDRLGYNNITILEKHHTVGGMCELVEIEAPDYVEHHGLKSIPKSVAHGYTASGYGFIQHMPYAYIHEFTRTSMAGKI